MAKNEIRIRAFLDDKVSTGLDRIRGKFDGLGKSKGFKSIAQGFGMGAGIAAFNLLGRAASSAVDFVFDSIQAGSDLNETLQKSQVVFGEAADDVERFGSAAALGMGLSKNATIAAAATFGNLFKSLGQAEADIAPMSKALVQLAVDLASFNNIDVEDALAKLQSGIVGQARPLRELGVAISEASVGVKAAELGFTKLNGTFTEGEKVQARYALIMEQTTDAQGDQARTSGQLAGQQRTLTALTEDLSAKLGQELVPNVIGAQEALIKLFEVINGFTSQRAAIADSVSEQIIGGSIAAMEQSKAALLKGMADLDKAHRDAGLRTWQTSIASEARKDLEVALDILEAGMRDFDQRGSMRNEAARDRIARAGRFAVDAIDAVGDAADELGPQAAIAFGDTAEFFEDMTGRMVDAASDAIDKAFDPLIAHDRLIAHNAEIASARRVLASGTATRAETRDARETLHSVGKDQAEALTLLAKAGRTGSKAFKKAVRELKQSIKDATGPTKAYLQSVYDEIMNVKQAGKVVPINFVISNTGKVFSGKKDGKEHGGRVSSGGAYIVGEKRPELFVPDRSGTILPSVPSMGSGGGSSSLTVNFNSVWPPTPEQARSIARVVDKQMYSALQRSAPTSGRV